MLNLKPYNRIYGGIRYIKIAKQVIYYQNFAEVGINTIADLCNGNEKLVDH